MTKWRSTLSKQARQLNRERLQDLSEWPTTFGDTEEFAGCDELQSMFMEAIKLAKHNTCPHKRTVRNCEVWLAGTLMLQNHQRSGAMTNMTRTELQWGVENLEVKDRRKLYHHKGEKKNPTRRPPKDESAYQHRSEWQTASFRTSSTFCQ